MVAPTVESQQSNDEPRVGQSENRRKSADSIEQLSRSNITNKRVELFEQLSNARKSHSSTTTSKTTTQAQQVPKAASKGERRVQHSRSTDMRKGEESGVGCEHLNAAAASRRKSEQETNELAQIVAQPDDDDDDDVAAHQTDDDAELHCCAVGEEGESKTQVSSLPPSDVHWQLNSTENSAEDDDDDSGDQQWDEIRFKGQEEQQQQIHHHRLENSANNCVDLLAASKLEEAKHEDEQREEEEEAKQPLKSSAEDSQVESQVRQIQSHDWPAPSRSLVCQSKSAPVLSGNQVEVKQTVEKRAKRGGIARQVSRIGKSVYGKLKRKLVSVDAHNSTSASAAQLKHQVSLVQSSPSGSQEDQEEQQQQQQVRDKTDSSQQVVLVKSRELIWSKSLKKSASRSGSQPDSITTPLLTLTRPSCIRDSVCQDVQQLFESSSNNKAATSEQSSCDSGAELGELGEPQEQQSSQQQQQVGGSSPIAKARQLLGRIFRDKTTNGDQHEQQVEGQANSMHHLEQPEQTMELHSRKCPPLL